MDLLNNRKVRKQILLTEDDATTLAQVSAVTKMSQNEIVNKALHAYMARFKKKLPNEA